MSRIELLLTNEPGLGTRNRKCLGDALAADFDYLPPLWELRVGEFRVFYVIDDPGRQVHVLAIRTKPPQLTTAKVLR